MPKLRKFLCLQSNRNLFLTNFNLLRLMKKLATLLIACFVVQFATAQYVIVNSPATISGSKGFSTGSMSVDLTTGVWTADAVMANDGSSTPGIGCGTLTNAAQITGKILLIDRGTCNFSTKVMNAKKAGALAVVVFNHTAGAGTIVMGTTAIAGDTLPAIPAVMLSYEDGLEIKAALAAGPVNITIGDVHFPNDLHTDKVSILNGPNGTMPVTQLSGYSFNPGSAVTNNGLNVAHNVDVNCVGKFTPAAGGAATTVYNQTGTITSIEVDSTQLAELPTFTPGTGVGKYAFTYSVTSDSLDDVDSDNAYGSEFTVSDNVFSKARWDKANNRPYQTNAYRPASSTFFEFISGFHIPSGKGYSLDSIKFYISTSAVDLQKATQGGLLSAYLYEWVDADSDGGLTAGEFTPISIEEVSFPTAGVKSAWVSSPIVDFSPGAPNNGQGYVIPADDKNYFVGIRYDGDSTVFIGFDEEYDHTAAIDLGSAVVTELDLGYLGTTTWDGLTPDLASLFTFTGNRSSLATGLYINTAVVGTDDQFAQNVTISLMPNPVSNELVAEVTLKEMLESIEYSILDVNGRLISRSVSDVNSNSDKALFNVSRLAAGQYFLKVKTEKGSKTTPFTVQH